MRGDEINVNLIIKGYVDELKLIYEKVIFTKNYQDERLNFNFDRFLGYLKQVVEEERTQRVHSEGFCQKILRIIDEIRFLKGKQKWELAKNQIIDSFAKI